MKLPRALQIALWPLSLIYGAAMRLRAWLYANGWLKQERLKGTVISVGNLTVGGTGKTPMVIWLADKFLAEGKSVAILSRGYRGSGSTSDEIELMKRHLCGRAQFGVGRDRVAEGRKMESEDIDLFLLDDGFQHLQLARDLDIVLVDATRPLDKELVLPAGRFREPRAALERAHMVVFTRSEQAEPRVEAIERFPAIARYSSTTKLLGFRRHSEPDAEPLRQLGPEPVFAFCGIGNPEAFWGDLARWGLKVVGRKAFRDHHRYTRREIQALEREAELGGARTLVTTEKDAENLDVTFLPRMPVDAAVIALEIPEEARFLRELKERLKVRRGVAA
jgi:tetraacyldisaccharide 4'-kinase